MLENTTVINIFLDVLILSSLEMILGVDNFIFINLLSRNFTGIKQNIIKALSTLLTLIIRATILLTVFKLLTFDNQLFHIYTLEFSIRSCTYLLGGGFLIIKAVLDFLEMFYEARMHSQVHDLQTNKIISKKINYNRIFTQIVVINIILSLDSVMTGISLSKNIYVVGCSIIFAAILMMIFNSKISKLIYKYYPIRITALLFIILLGINMFVLGLGIIISKSTLYISIIFTILNQLIGYFFKKLKAKA